MLAIFPYLLFLLVSLSLSFFANQLREKFIESLHPAKARYGAHWFWMGADDVKERIRGSNYGDLCGFA